MGPVIGSGRFGTYTRGGVTAMIAQDFIAYNEKHGIHLSPEEKTLFFITPWIHDWGELVIEGIGIGDVTFEQKTDNEEKTELKVFEFVLQNVDDDAKKELMAKAYREVAMDRNTKLGRMFNAVERVGYLLTAIRAFDGIEGARRIGNWRGLVGNVLSNQIEKLVEYRKEYPYVDFLLQQETAKISHMFENVLSEDVPFDRDGSPSYNLEKLQKADLFGKQR